MPVGLTILAVLLIKSATVALPTVTLMITAQLPPDATEMLDKVTSPDTGSNVGAGKLAEFSSAHVVEALTNVNSTGVVCKVSENVTLSAGPPVLFNVMV